MSWETPEPEDEVWMRQALWQAVDARERGERPFGTVIVNPQGFAIAYRGGSETDDDPTCHSEINAIRDACKLVGGLLREHTMYTTHEPCTMCCGAIVHSKLSRVVWGSNRRDMPQLFRPRGGPRHATALLADTSQPPSITTGVCAAECVRLFDTEVREAMSRGIR